MKYLIVAFALLACTNKQKCDLQDKVVASAATAIANGLSCSNLEAVKKSINDQALKVGFCKPEAQSVGSDLCKGLVTGLVGSFVADKIPVEWGCDLTSTKEKIAELVGKACESVL